MKINGNDIYFEVDMQKYIEVKEYFDDKRRKIIEIKIVSKEYIKRSFFTELKKTNNNIDIKEFKDRLKWLFLIDIESIKLTFNQYCPKEYEEGGYKCLNLLFNPNIYLKCSNKVRDIIKYKGNEWEKIKFL